MISNIFHRIHPRTCLGMFRGAYNTLLALISTVAPTRGASTLTFNITREVVRNTEIERRGFEFDLATGKLRPLVSCSVDPPDEIEMIHAIECTEVCALWPLSISYFRIKATFRIPIWKMLRRRDHHLDLLSQELQSVAIYYY